MENVRSINTVEVDEELTEVERTGLPPQEELARNEADIIKGLLEAADYKEDDNDVQPVEIKRNGKVLFDFKIRPLGEDELMRIRKSSTPQFPNPAGKRLPKIEGDIRLGEFRSKKIYTATVEEDRKLLWDNPQVKQGLKAKGFDILESWEIIDAVLKAGEKDRLSDLIDEISGYDADLTEYAKN